MLAIRLKPPLEKRLSRQTGQTRTSYATKLIEENVEDLEDRYLAQRGWRSTARPSAALRCAGSLAWRIECLGSGGGPEGA